MAELRSLLSYMDGTQRDKVLRHYEAMFDEAGPDEEDTLIHILGSPVRQVLQVEKEFQEAAARGEEPFATAVLPVLKKEPETPPAAEQPAYQDRMSVESFEDVFAAAMPAAPTPAEPIPAMEEDGAQTEPTVEEEPVLWMEDAPVPTEGPEDAECETPPEEEEPAPEEVTAVPETAVVPVREKEAEEAHPPIERDEAPPPEEREDFAAQPAEKRRAEDKGPGAGRVLGAILVTIPLLVLWIVGFALSIVLGAVFIGAAAAVALLGGYLASYVLSGVLTFMPDLLLVAGGALITFALALLLLWLGLWVLIGGIIRTVKISASVYRSNLKKKGERGRG